MNPPENSSNSVMQNFEAEKNSPNAQSSMAVEERKKSSFWSSFIKNSRSLLPPINLNFSAKQGTEKNINYFQKNSPENPPLFPDLQKQVNELFKMKAITLLDENCLFSFKKSLDSEPITYTFYDEGGKSFVILRQTFKVYTIEGTFERIHGKPIPISFNISKASES